MFSKSFLGESRLPLDSKYHIEVDFWSWFHSPSYSTILLTVELCWEWCLKTLFVSYFIFSILSVLIHLQCVSFHALCSICCEESVSLFLSVSSKQDTLDITAGLLWHFKCRISTPSNGLWKRLHPMVVWKRTCPSFSFQTSFTFSFIVHQDCITRIVKERLSFLILWRFDSFSFPVYLTLFVHGLKNRRHLLL